MSYIHLLGKDGFSELEKYRDEYLTAHPKRMKWKIKLKGNCSCGTRNGRAICKELAQRNCGRILFRILLLLIMIKMKVLKKFKMKY